MTGYRMRKQYSILQSMPGYMTSGWAPVLQVLKLPIVAQLVVTGDGLAVHELIRHDAG